MPSSRLVAGLSGGTRHACVALCSSDRIFGICEQERITRVRGAGVNATGLPDEALDEVLRLAGRQRADVTAYAGTRDVPAPVGIEPVYLDHHLTHACSAFLPSPFDQATVVICDDESPQMSVWHGDGRCVSRGNLDWNGMGFARFYSQCAEALGFLGEGKEQRMEALARLNPLARDDRTTKLVALECDRLRIAEDFEARVESWVGGGDLHGASLVAGALQSRIGDLLVEFLLQIKGQPQARKRLCVGGSLFHNSHFNSRVKQSGEFGDVFVPIDPGNAGLSLGAALHVSQHVREPVSPFLGPSYTVEEIKATLENCKLTYRWLSESDAIDIAVGELKKGRLVGWFDGAMEWGPRTLGARSILANPFAPYVLDNLNRFLKKREVWRGYALSGLDSAVHELFEGPDASPFMECDFLPRDRQLFRHILPGPNAALRVHTVTPQASPRFHGLLQAFGRAEGAPVLVNTSFNGFREPIVCSTRDAVRVFFGTGLDLLVCGQFVVSK